MAYRKPRHNISGIVQTRINKTSTRNFGTEKHVASNSALQSKESSETNSEDVEEADSSENNIEDPLSPILLSENKRSSIRRLTYGWRPQKPSACAKLSSNFNQNLQHLQTGSSDKKAEKQSSISVPSTFTHHISDLPADAAVGDSDACSSPILGKPRDSCRSQAKQATVITPNWKKLRKDHTKVDHHQSPPIKTVKAVPHDSPSSVFLNHDDSLLENIDLEHLDSFCLSLESTPKRKVSNKRQINKTPSSNKYVSRNVPDCCKISQGTETRHLPVRNRGEEAGDGQENLIKCKILSEEFPTSKDAWLKKRPKYLSRNFKCIIPESSYSSSSNSSIMKDSVTSSGSPDITVVIQQKNAVCNPQHLPSISDQERETSCSQESHSGDGVRDPPHELQHELASVHSQQLGGRDSPDIFGGEQDFSTNDQFSDPFNAELCVIEERVFDESSDVTENETSPKLGNNTEQKTALGNANTQDSEVSFTSTLDSQPLIDRFQGRMKNISQLSGQ